MADQDVTELTEETDPDLDGLVYFVKDPSGTPLDRGVSLQNLIKQGPMGTFVTR
jgi:hypothetical protein